VTTEQKPFETLLNEAPPAPAAKTVSLVGTLAQSSEEGKFVLIMQDGSAVTLETAAVKGHTVLGSSLGQTIVRVDVDTDKVGSSLVLGTHPGADAYPQGTGFADPLGPNTLAEGIPDPSQLGGQVQAAGLAPFALATMPQAPAAVRAAFYRYTGVETGGYLEAPGGVFTGVQDLTVVETPYDRV
jgi:hypothetical protein